MMNENRRKRIDPADSSIELAKGPLPFRVVATELLARAYRYIADVLEMKPMCTNAGSKVEPHESN